MYTRHRQTGSKSPCLLLESSAFANISVEGGNTLVLLFYFEDKHGLPTTVILHGVLKPFFGSFGDQEV